MQYNESPVVIHVNKNPNVIIKCFSWCVGRQGTSTMHNFSLISGCVDYLTLGFAPFSFPFSIFVCLFVSLFVCLSGGVSMCTIYMRFTRQ